MNIRLATLSDLVDIELIYNEAVKHMNDEGNYLQWIDFDSFKTGVINYIENNLYTNIKKLLNNGSIIFIKESNLNLDELFEFLRNSEIENIICLPKTGEYIKEGSEVVLFT